ncbi:Hypothetical_protein [Hexamita inflata]|uniref:Hypothetical_protein n=1 Tax=Hexamita inflata TaxID=28002 RepID=A0ABP1J672_9EUKA
MILRLVLWQRYCVTKCEQDVIQFGSAAKLQSRCTISRCFLFVNNECSFFSSQSLSRGAFGNVLVRVLIGYVDKVLMIRLRESLYLQHMLEHISEQQISRYSLYSPQFAILVIQPRNLIILKNLRFETDMLEY